MKVSRASEEEMDRRLRLDKRKDSRAFCRYFNREETLPTGFYDLQDKIRDGLEKEFWANFDDGADRSKPPGRRVPKNKYFYFSAELLISERLIIELSDGILGDALIDLTTKYLRKNESDYCIIGAIYEGEIKGKNYIGRFVLTRSEITVEESLVQAWSERVSSGLEV